METFNFRQHLTLPAVAQTVTEKGYRVRRNKQSGEIVIFNDQSGVEETVPAHEDESSGEAFVRRADLIAAFYRIGVVL